MVPKGGFERLTLQHPASGKLPITLLPLGNLFTRSLREINQPGNQYHPDKILRKNTNHASIGCVAVLTRHGDSVSITEQTVSRQWRDAMVKHEQPSLYERLGGVYNIATVVDDFIDRIMVDPRLNANPRVGEAHHRVSPAGFKYLVTEMVCWATGGPQRYTGRSMRDVHQHLQITATEWDAFMDDFQQTLDKFGVPEAEQAELKSIVEGTRADIVI
jgi:hemoglobin